MEGSEEGVGSSVNLAVCTREYLQRDDISPTCRHATTASTSPAMWITHPPLTPAASAEHLPPDPECDPDRDPARKLQDSIRAAAPPQQNPAPRKELSPP